MEEKRISIVKMCHMRAAILVVCILQSAIRVKAVVDKNQFCSDWAKSGECQKNPAYMNVNCARSCNTVQSPTRFVDRSQYCPSWALNGKCSSNVLYMQANCQLSCSTVQLGTWSGWSSYGSCSKSCGSGTQRRTRSCVRHSGQQPCPGENSQSRKCNNESCQGTCSLVRRGGCIEWPKYRIMNRLGTSFDDCENMCKGKATCGGFMLNSNNNECSLLTDVWKCTTGESNKGWMKLYRCILRYGTWSGWSSYGSCSKSCGSGTQRRTRSCVRTSGQQPCPEENSQSRKCNNGECPVIQSDWPLNELECGIRGRLPLVVGGEDAALGRWPWQVGIMKKLTRGGKSTWRFHCGGTILNKKFILSAAHCFLKRASADMYQVRLGEVNLKQKEEHEQLRSVSKIEVHEEFNSDTYENDIALVTLRTPIESYNEDIKPSCLPKSPNSEPIENSTCHVTGWGYQEKFSGEVSVKLQEAQLPLVERSACNAAMEPAGGHVFDNMICAGNGKGTTDVCNGDSGGPLTCRKQGDIRFIQTGIVSWGLIGCATPGYYGVFTKISNYLGWIEARMVLSPP